MTVENLNEHRMRVKGENMFLGCPCGGTSGFQIVVLSGKSRPVITTLVCSDCGGEDNVTYGEVEM